MNLAQTATRYRCGVTSDCPFAVLYLAGLDFPKVTEKVTGSGPDTKRTEIRGVIRDLEAAQVAAVKKAAAGKFVRTTNGKSARSRLFSKTSRGFKFDPATDVCVTRYLYLEATESTPYEEVRPATLEDELSAETAPEPTPAKAPAKRK